MKTCNFCDLWGAAAYPEWREEDLKNQIIRIMERIKWRFKAEKFLIYFQSYTNSFAKVDRLRKQFQVAEAFDDVLGFVVGTRPDCLSRSVFDLWRQYAQSHFLSVELGVQSFDESQLLWMRRGHTAQRSLKAIEKMGGIPEIDLGVHLMFGLPSETDKQIIETARTLSSLPVTNVKLHNLHVLKNTPLEKEYLAGRFEPCDRESYAQRIQLFLQYLRPSIAIHRLAAVASRHDELVAPTWVANKLDSYQFIIDFLNKNGAFQGQYFEA